MSRTNCHGHNDVRAIEIRLLFVFESLGNSSNRSRKQMLMDILGKFSYFIIALYIVCSH